MKLDSIIEAIGVEPYYREVRPVINYKVIKLCKRSYPNHKNGCPNWNKKKGCPPTLILNRVIDVDKSVYAIYNRFNFAAHVNRMKSKHPDWSKRQLECCLYWQGTARKQLKNHIKLFLAEHRGYHVLDCPEACGVDITATMKSIGIELEWPPVNYIYRVALAGVPLIAVQRLQQEVMAV